MSFVQHQITNFYFLFSPVQQTEYYIQYVVALPLCFGRLSGGWQLVVAVVVVALLVTPLALAADQPEPAVFEHLLAVVLERPVKNSRKICNKV